MQICKKVIPLLFLLTLIIIACVHSAMVLLSPDESGVSANFVTFDDVSKNCITPGNVTANFGTLLSYHLSMTAGDFDSADTINKIFFLFFINIVILNIIIALVGDVYNKVKKSSSTKWTILRAHIIAHFEIASMLPFEYKNQDYFPWTIVYEASTKKVDKHTKKVDKHAKKVDEPTNLDEIQEILDTIMNSDVNRSRTV